MTLVFAINYAAARAHMRREGLDDPRWVYVDEPQRLYGLEPEACQVLKLDGWQYNLGAVDALRFWDARIASRKQL